MSVGDSLLWLFLGGKKLWQVFIKWSLVIFLQGVVQSIQNGNNMHREVYKDLHKECTFVYTKVYKGAHIMQKYTKVQIENNNCTTEFVLAWRRRLACYSVVHLVRKTTYWRELSTNNTFTFSIKLSSGVEEVFKLSFARIDRPFRLSNSCMTEIFNILNYVPSQQDNVWTCDYYDSHICTNVLGLKQECDIPDSLIGILWHCQHVMEKP